MINAWSLLYDELYEDDEMSEEIFNVGAGNTASDSEGLNINVDNLWDSVTINTTEFATWNGDDAITTPEFATWTGDDAITTPVPDYISTFESDTVTPGIESKNTRKYKEDESIEALKNYISTTYGGHYTSDNNSVQTLDLIESVGDAESFCRSNAIKYLSRYDKKGQAKRDILKALHYSLLLYHFSGQLNETPTRGYETF